MCSISLHTSAPVIPRLYTAMSHPLEAEITVVEAALVALKANDPEAAIALLDWKLEGGALGRETSTVLHARVPNATARKFTALAQRAGLAPGVLARVVLTSAVKLTGPTLAKVADLLDLPADATIADVIARLKELFPEGPAEPAPKKPAPSDGGDALGGTAASAPAKKLSAKEEAYCRKHNITPAQFAARKAESVRTTSTRKARR